MKCIISRINYKHIRDIVYLILIIVLGLVALMVALSGSSIPSGIRFYTVQSGSMAPSIPAGSIVIVKPLIDYKKGDVITFKSDSDRANNKPKYTTTHRIYEVINTPEGVRYETKGDYNQTTDGNRIDKGLVLGKVVFSVPILGYMVNFAKTQTGFIVLIVIPATIIVWSELMNIKNEAKKLIAERKKRKLTAKEKLKVKIGKEEMVAEKGIKKFLKKISAKFSK